MNEPAPLAASQGRTAIVTGGTGAIGTAICRRLVANGMRCAAIGHPGERERLAQEAPDFPVRLADLADATATADAFASLQDELGPIAVLVNAAGITRDARFVKMSDAQWREVMGSNLDSVFHSCKAVFATMCERGFGRIVNISSVNGQRGQFGQANYAAAKAGMHGLTMSLAQEGARHGVTVNTVAPGYVQTPMTAAMRADVLERIVGEVPMRRMAQPEEIADAVAFLCSDRAAYITGALLPVNGGLHMSA
ncbi:MAG: acetoacetyl-CoA reductase [Nevskiales bacterium]|nr:acetoacetyl-CoA reductase [Nevskiales bacterium]